MLSASDKKIVDAIKYQREIWAIGCSTMGSLKGLLMNRRYAPVKYLKGAMNKAYSKGNREHFMRRYLTELERMEGIYDFGGKDMVQYLLYADGQITTIDAEALTNRDLWPDEKSALAKFIINEILNGEDPSDWVPEWDWYGENIKI